MRESQRAREKDRLDTMREILFPGVFLFLFQLAR
jgi:hypothetical protein